MWYGIGNTSLANPSEIEIGIRADGTVVLFSGATDIGQGSNTVLAQIAADALGVPVASIERVGPDTDRTPGRRQDLGLAPDVRVGNATRLAGEDLRRQLLTLAEAGPDATIEIDGGRVAAPDGATVSFVELRRAARARLAAACCWARRRTTRRRRRSTRMARASRTRRTRSARRSRRSTSTSSSGP